MNSTSEITNSLKTSFELIGEFYSSFEGRPTGRDLCNFYCIFIGILANYIDADLFRFCIQQTKDQISPQR